MDESGPLLLAGPLWTATDTARRLALHRGTIYAWAKSGRLPHIKVGGKFVRFVPDEIERWAAEHRGGAK